MLLAIGGSVFWILLPYFFAGLFVLLFLAIAVVLVMKWLRTRDAGIAWLAVAVVIWPLISRLLSWGETTEVRHLMRHEHVGLFPFSLVGDGKATIWGLFSTLNSLQQLIGLGLLLVAVVYLYKREDDSDRIETKTAVSNSEA
jgi:hypothetical protein